jgi:hypothetical protein
MIEVGKKYLVTTDSWFTAPDGTSYKAVFGTATAIQSAEQTLGIKPNARSTNWYVIIGKVVIAGCQIHYAIQTDTCSSARSKDWAMDAKEGLKECDTPSKIYFTD